MIQQPLKSHDDHVFAIKLGALGFEQNGDKFNTAHLPTTRIIVIQSCMEIGKVSVYILA